MSLLKNRKLAASPTVTDTPAAMDRYAVVVRIADQSVAWTTATARAAVVDHSDSIDSSALSGQTRAPEYRPRPH